MIKRLVQAAAAAFLIVHAATPWAQLVSSKPVRVGFIGPLTGGSAEMGASSRLGAELAIKEINEVGGFVGRQFELVPRDDKADPDEGLKAAQDLVLKEKVDFTIGFSNSGVAFKALDTFQSNRHLLMVPVATATAITTRIPPKGSYIFRLSIPDSIQTAVLVDDALKTSNRVAVFADTTGYGEAGLQDTVKALESKHVQAAYIGRFPIGVKSLVDEVRAARAAGAESIICFTVQPEFAVLAVSRLEAGFRGRIYGAWGASHRAVLERAGAHAVEGIVMPQSFIQDWSNESRSSFVLRLKRLAGNAPISTMMAAAQTYDAVHLMLRAMFQTNGDTSGPALKSALENLGHSYAGVVTTYDRPFTESDHDAYTRNMAWLGTWQNGEVQFLYPQDAKLSAMVRHKQWADDPAPAPVAATAGKSGGKQPSVASAK